MAQGKQVIWVLTGTLEHSAAMGRQHGLRHAQVECITAQTLYRLRGTITPVVAIPDCFKLKAPVLSRLDIANAIIVYLGCDCATH